MMLVQPVYQVTLAEVMLLTVKLKNVQFKVKPAFGLRTSTDSKIGGRVPALN